MQTSTTQSNGSNHQQPNAQAKPAGSVFDLVRKVGEENGKAKWAKHGTLFMRANNSGGVVYWKPADGEELEIAVFPRKARG